MPVQKKERLFTNAMLLALILPLVAEQAVNLTVGFCDSIMVSAVGEAAVSGVSLIDNINQLLLNIFSALSTGGAVITGQYLGRKEKDLAGESADALLRSMMWLSCGLTIVMYAIRGFILGVVFGQISADVYQSAHTYLMIVNLSIPFMGMYNSAGAVMRVTGDSRRVFLVSLGMGIVNLIGNTIGIYVLHAGIAGVAVPTLVARAAGGVGMLLMLKYNKTLSASPHMLRRSPKGMLGRILNIGIPNGLENGLFQLGKIVLVSLVSAFGTAAIASNAVAGSLAGIQVIPGFAINLGLTTVVSRCAGAGDYEQVRYYTKKLLAFSYLSVAVISLILLGFMDPILHGLYTLSDETAALTSQLMILHTVFVMTVWPISFGLPNTFRAVGDVRYTMVIAIVSMWVFRLVGGYVIGSMMGYGVVGVWIAMMLDWVFRMVMFLIRYFRGTWERFRAI